MKILLDFLPILLFFAAFKYTNGDKDWAAALATEHLGFMVAGGQVGPSEAPVMLATVVVVLATLGQVVVQKARGREVKPMLWVSLVLVLVLGGLTVWLHSETFIKWKPTLLYWVMASALWIGTSFFDRNLLRTLVGEQLKLPDPVWRRLNVAWVVFFLTMGCLNLWIAYAFSTEAWVNFKLFGGIGLMVLFTLAQGYFLRHYLQEDPAPPAVPPEER